ncbi:hypothetical protein LUZ63_012103 [Rhynchospora breviuscula]|uniref:ABC transporter domain-containing protein n=1 Tax=Rhynchospora breviuscula TaxID=2022672 RepID=A0A9Q0CKF9_9POAL|nr:hypothetical protein LUZ63_012103 [Rhynchospora breviuscula]
MGRKDEPKPTWKPSKLVVSAVFASMDNPTRTKSAKPKPKPKPNAKSYLDNADLPPSDEDDEAAVLVSKPASKGRAGLGLGLAEHVLTEKETKKKGRREEMKARAAEMARQEALKEDHDAFVVVSGSRATATADDDASNSSLDNVRDIVVENFSVFVAGKKLFNNASLKISHGKRYGLVGPNGKGKSTLLKLLAWRKVPVPRNIDVLLVEQEIVGDDRSALQAVVSADEELMKLRAEAQSLSEADDKDAADEDGDRLREIYEKLQLKGSDAAEALVSKILAGLGFTKVMQARPTKSFSGGWRMRISLARALFMQPTLLLLDEPTNHLDLRAVLWLEEYLCQWKRTLIVVSHDRDFLNAVCNEIIHLHDLKLKVHGGNFDDFESGYEQERRKNNKDYEKVDKRMKVAIKSGSKAQQDKVKGQALLKAAKSKRKGKASQDDDDPAPSEVPKKWIDYSVEFHFPEPTELTPPLLQLIEVGFSYLNRPDFKLQNVDVGIDMGTRVAIVGPNGAGKSTLLNLLAGDSQPTEGEMRRSQKLRIGRYSQHFVDLLTMEEDPVHYLLRLHPDQEGCSKEETVRAKLGKFGLPSHNHSTPIAKLSGGQKARVVFTSISMSKPHILLLDEPTNHLDIQSIDALAEALEEFTGGVVLVSHDSRLISRVCDDEERSEIWVVEDGTVRRYPDSFQDYKEELMKEIITQVEE